MKFRDNDAWKANLLIWFLYMLSIIDFYLYEDLTNEISHRAMNGDDK